MVYTKQIMFIWQKNYFALTGLIAFNKKKKKQKCNQKSDDMNFKCPDEILEKNCWNNCS